MHSSGNLQSNFINGFIFIILTDCSFLVWVPVHIFGNSLQSQQHRWTWSWQSLIFIILSYIVIYFVPSFLFIIASVILIVSQVSISKFLKRTFLPFRNFNTIWRLFLQLGLHWIVRSLRCQDWRQRGGSPRSLQHRRSVHTSSPLHLQINLIPSFPKQVT